jgi:hypothetical protein
MRSIIHLHHQGFLFLICALGMAVSSSAQTPDTLQPGAYHTARFEVTPRDTIIALTHQFIVGGTETVVMDSFRLSRDKEYSLQSRSGTIVLHPQYFRFAWPDSTIKRHLVIRYQALPFTFQQSYRHREPVTRYDSLTKERITVAQPSKPFLFDDLFGSNLQKSGSIVRGLTIGSNRDLTLNSGFRMQMSGNLTNDLQVIAALTDENSPIQPEGTTQTLQEVDKVFIELRGTNVGATLGDFNLSLAGNEFGGLNRKLQGGKGIANFAAGGINSDVMVTGATARGKFTTNQFQGIDGVQGPYRLSGQNNERTIIVITGTERVYVNGERMIRGEINDYVIDYATSEVTFTSRRLITSVSRITIDFEYSDRQFNRNLIGANVSTKFLNEKVKLTTTFIREGDDENSPVDVALSDSDKSVLQLAGGDRSKAIRSGVVYVGPGKGQYIAQDSMIHNSPSDSTLITYFRYAPNDSANAVYNVTFSFVGAGHGDYNKVALSQYGFVGVNKGSYAPVRMLPLPQSTTLYDFNLDARLTDGLRVLGEYALSNFDANRFSQLDDIDKNGSAVKVGVDYSQKDIRIGAMSLGAIDINLRERYINKRFVALDRFNEVEFNRKWNIQDSSQANEELREGAITYTPKQSLMFTSSLGSVTRGDQFTSNRYTGGLRFYEEGIPSFSYDMEVIKSRNTSSESEGDWIRHRGFVRDTLGHVSPTLRYEGEVFRNRGTTLDTLKRESFRYHEITPGVSIVDIGKMLFRAEFGWRLEDSLAMGSLQRASNTFTQQYHWQLRDWNSLTSSLDFTVRNKALAAQFQYGGEDHLQTVLLRWQTHYTPFDGGAESDLFYEASSERSAKLERVFQRVPKGSGNYVYVGDVNDNHAIDAQDFQQTRFDGDFIALALPTDELIPVVDVKASARLRLNGSRITSPSSWLTKGLSYLSNETYIRVDEKSMETDTRQIYFLHLSKFLNDQTTIIGSNIFTDDFYVLENNSQFSCRLRFSQREGLTQFALQNERAYTRERSVRLRWQLIKEFANQTDVIERRDNLASTQFSSRVRNINSVNVITDWSYRPEQAIEIGFKFGMGQAANFDTTEANLNDQSVRFVYSIPERGQARIEFAREEVTVNRSATIIPFELTNGKVYGKTWLWHMSTEYRFTKVIQANLNYDGRSEGDRGVVHTVRAEVRAFF